VAGLTTVAMFVITASISIVTVVLWLINRKRGLSKASNGKQKRTSDFIIMVGLVLSSVLDPAAKNKIEALDSQRKRKLEAGKENK
jgi:hypothetical protein